MSALIGPSPIVRDVSERGVLRLLTCGSVDDGKSTLIGRLLHDTLGILADTLIHLEEASRRKGLSSVDLSLLTDGLQAEREQGITIDVAYRYFSTGRRKYIIADSPGHEQYTRNMVTAASTAQLALILVDARKGVVTQTRRHSCLAHLVGIRHLVVVVNKMDLVGYDEAVFDRIRADYLAFARELGIADIDFVPISALEGDMVVERGGNLGWYDGPTLIEILETTPAGYDAPAQSLRLPVQYVCRPHNAADPTLHDYRGIQGRVDAGSVTAGDTVTVLPAGIQTRVRAIHIGGQEIPRAIADQSVTLLLEDDIDISRGDMIVGTGHGPRITRQLDAMICWLGGTPLDPRRMYRVHHTTRKTRALFSGEVQRLDIDSLETVPADSLAMNDIAGASLRLAQPLCVDSYSENRATGAFIIIDEASHETVGCGMIL